MIFGFKKGKYSKYKMANKNTNHKIKFNFESRRPHRVFHNFSPKSQYKVPKQNDICFDLKKMRHPLFFQKKIKIKNKNQNSKYSACGSGSALHIPYDLKNKKKKNKKNSTFGTTSGGSAGGRHCFASLRLPGVSSAVSGR